MASKVEELARYRSEFFGKLREALAGQRDVQIVGDRFVFQSEVLFPSGSAQLQPAGEKQLAEVAQRLIEIASLGFPRTSTGCSRSTATPTTSRSATWSLSVELGTVGRARHRRREVPATSQGIPNERLVAAGYGEYQPLSAIDSARNRRIELKLTSR